MGSKNSKEDLAQDFQLTAQLLSAISALLKFSIYFTYAAYMHTLFLQLYCYPL